MISGWRLRVILLGMLIIVIGLLGRVFYLMILDRNFLLGQGNARSLRVVSIPAYRGMITDRNGYPMAVSTPVASVWIDPHDFNPSSDDLDNLTSILNIPSNQILAIAQKEKDKEFVYIARDLDPYVGEEIRALNIPGVYLQQEFHRYYPEGETSAQLLGFTNIDDIGQEGIELEYNNWLEGTPGKKQVLKDRYGREVAGLDLIRQAQPGHNLALSIDHQIQYIAYTALKQTVQYYKAAWGSVVVIDVKTGEVLAMVNQPSYNPNNRPNRDDGSFRNRALTDVFEPGSTNKAFTISNALISRKYTPNTIIDTRPGYFFVGGGKVRDDGNYGVITVTGVLQRSSNVGASKITLSLPPDSLWQILHKIGYGQKTDSGFPGESPGVLLHQKHWRPFALATMSFGYGISVTNLQLAQSYAILANNGIKIPISLLRTDRPLSEEQIIPTEVAKSVRDMLLSVVEPGGTGYPYAVVPGYKVSGKTGTVQIAASGGYEHNHHDAMFIGMAPETHPRFVVSVMVADPKGPRGEYFGGEVAAPVFATVMAAALRIKAIPPDNLPNTPVLIKNSSSGQKNP